MAFSSIAQKITQNPEINAARASSVSASDGFLTPESETPGIKRGGALNTSLDIGFGETRVGANNSITQEQNQFTDLSKDFAGAAGAQLDAAGNPLLDLQTAGISEEGVGASGQAVTDQFGNTSAAMLKATQTQFDPQTFANTQFDKLQSLASRGEEIAANRVANNLFGSGRLGANDTASGAAFEGLARAQHDARTARSLKATDMATKEADRLFAQGQVGVQNEFQLLDATQGKQGADFNQLIQGEGFNFQGSQTNLQTAQNLGQNAGAVLDPNFAALDRTTGLRVADQGTRADVYIARKGASAKKSAAGMDAFGNIVGGAVTGFMMGGPAGAVIGGGLAVGSESVSAMNAGVS